MRPNILAAPGEFIFAILMAASPMIGAIWVTPDLTKWLVFSAGALMTIGVLVVGLLPERSEASPPSSAQ